MVVLNFGEYHVLHPVNVLAGQCLLPLLSKGFDGKLCLAWKVILVPEQVKTNLLEKELLFSHSARLQSNFVQMGIVYDSIKRLGSETD